MTHEGRASEPSRTAFLRLIFVHPDKMLIWIPQAVYLPEEVAATSALIPSMPRGLCIVFLPNPDLSRLGQVPMQWSGGEELDGLLRMICHDLIRCRVSIRGAGLVHTIHFLQECSRTLDVFQAQRTSEETRTLYSNIDNPLSDQQSSRRNRTSITLLRHPHPQLHHPPLPSPQAHPSSHSPLASSQRPLHIPAVSFQS